MTELSQSGSKRLILYPSSIIRDWISICCKSCTSISETFLKAVNFIKKNLFYWHQKFLSNFNKSNSDGEFSFCVKPFSLWFISDVVVVVWKPTRSIKVQNSWEGDKIQKLFQTCFKNLRELICNSARGCKKSLKSFYLTPFSKQESGED